MATMTRREPGGERIYHVPFDGPLPGAPFGGAGALVLETTGLMGRLTGIQLRFYPGTAELEVELPQLARTLGRSPFEFSRLLGRARAVVEYTASSAVLRRVPLGLRDLSSVEAFLARGPGLFDLAEYRLASITFDTADETDAMALAGVGGAIEAR